MTDCPCGQPHAGLVCDGCHAQAYCGEACQRNDWAVHQQECVGGVISRLFGGTDSNKKSLLSRVKDAFKKKTPEQQAAASAVLAALPGLNDTSVENQIRNLLKSARFAN